MIQDTLLQHSLGWKTEGLNNSPKTSPAGEWWGWNRAI